MKSLILTLLIILPGSVMAESDSAVRLRFVCQAVMNTEFYANPPGGTRIFEPRLIVFDQDEPMETSYLEFLETPVDFLEREREYTPFTIYATSRRDDLNLSLVFTPGEINPVDLSDELTDADILEVSEKIVEHEKNNPFSIQTQSGTVKAQASVQWLDISFEAELGDGLTLESWVYTTPGFGKDGEVYGGSGEYKGPPPEGRTFGETSLSYRCYGPFQVPENR